jgi:hypothetical protein
LLAVARVQLDHERTHHAQNNNTTHQNQQGTKKNANAKLWAFLSAMLLLLSSIFGSIGINKITPSPTDPLGGVLAIVVACITYSMAYFITIFQSGANDQ